MDVILILVGENRLFVTTRNFADQNNDSAVEQHLAECCGTASA